MESFPTFVTGFGPVGTSIHSGHSAQSVVSHILTAPKKVLGSYSTELRNIPSFKFFDLKECDWGRKEHPTMRVTCITISVILKSIIG